MTDSRRIYLMDNDTQLCQQCYDAHPQYSHTSLDMIEENYDCDGCGCIWGRSVRAWVAVPAMAAMGDAVASHSLWEGGRVKKGGWRKT